MPKNVIRLVLDLDDNDLSDNSENMKSLVDCMIQLPNTVKHLELRLV